MVDPMTVDLALPKFTDIINVAAASISQINMHQVAVTRVGAESVRIVGGNNAFWSAARQFSFSATLPQWGFKN